MTQIEDIPTTDFFKEGFRIVDIGVPNFSLSTSEMQIVGLLHLRNNEIAEQLNKSEKAIKASITEIYKKCGTKNRTATQNVCMPAIIQPQLSANEKEALGLLSMGLGVDSVARIIFDLKYEIQTMEDPNRRQKRNDYEARENIYQKEYPRIRHAISRSLKSICEKLQVPVADDPMTRVRIAVDRAVKMKLIPDRRPESWRQPKPPRL